MTRSRRLRITFRVNLNEHELITWAALNDGMTLSEFLREAALERAAQVLVAVSTEKESA